MKKLIAIMAALALAACSTTIRPGASPVTKEVASSGGWAAGQAAFREAYARQAGVKRTESGLLYRRLSPRRWGAPRPPKGSVVTIHYVGRLITGEVFDSSRERGEPATFPLPRLIQGWQEGVPFMREGETFEFVIPADLAYGERVVADIPAGSTLIFEIKLLDAPGAMEERS